MITAVKSRKMKKEPKRLTAPVLSLQQKMLLMTLYILLMRKSAEMMKEKIPKIPRPIALLVYWVIVVETVFPISVPNISVRKEEKSSMKEFTTPKRDMNVMKNVRHGIAATSVE